MGEYDRTMKSLVTSDPEAIARFVLHEWQKQTNAVLPEVKITAVTELSGESQSEDLDADNVLLIEGPDGLLYMVEIEFQSELHSYMPLRSLEYCARAKKKHWKICGELPVIAAVIYLFEAENAQESPLLWPAPNGRTAMAFYYLSIKLKELPQEELLALHKPALLPLVLLTMKRVDRIIVGDMFAELIEQKLTDLLPIGHTIASWLMRGDDLIWLKREYDKMHDLFQDAPALKWMEETAREDERKKANQRVLEERKRMLTSLRQMVVALVAQRFPTLQRLATSQVRTLKRPERFQQVILRLSLAGNADEAQDALFALTEENDEENDSGADK